MPELRNASGGSVPEPRTGDGGHPLENFFWPRSIAVIGASEDTKKIRGKVMDVLLQHAFSGPIYPVTPTRTEVRGLKAYASIRDVSAPVDLALVAVPPETVLPVIEDCAATGVRGAVIFTSGFAEAGGEAARWQARMSEIAAETGMHLCGPNSIGFFNLRGRIACTFSPSAMLTEGLSEHIERAVGGIGIAAQSGGLSFALFNRGLRRRLGFSFVVSAGNEASLQAADFADYMLADEHTDLLMLFLESARDGDKLISLARKAADAGKPIVVAKVGRSEAGRRAAASHTASLTGSDAAYDAVFRLYGVFRVDDQEDMLDIAAALSMCPLPRGDRVAIVTSSGGSGAWMADACAQAGLSVPSLDTDTRDRIRALLPSYGSADNPVDTTAQAVDSFTSIIELALQSDAIDAMVVVAPLALRSSLPFDGERLRKLVKDSGKPVLLFSYTLPSESARDFMREVGVPVYDSFPGCARGLRGLVDYARFQADWRRSPALCRQADDRQSARLTDLIPSDRQALAEYEAKALLRAYGIVVPREFLVHSGEEAVEKSREVKAAAGVDAVALKIQSPQIPHKTDAGGVLLGLRSDDQVREGYDTVMAAARRFSPDARLHGVLVQPMLSPGIEVLAGFVEDETLGPIVTVGMGGIFAEVLADVASAPAPLDAEQAERLIGRLKGSLLLKGARGRPPADIGALATFLASLSRLAVDCRGRLSAFDVNPLLIYGVGQGVTVVDAAAEVAPAHLPLTAP